MEINEYEAEGFNKNMKNEISPIVEKTIKDKRPFESLTYIRDITPLIEILKNEESRTIAMVLIYLRPTQAAEFLANLNIEKLSDVAIAIANFQPPKKDILTRVEQFILKKIENEFVEEKLDGVKTLIYIMNNINRTREKELVSEIKKKDANLYKQIMEKLFQFEDILKLDNYAIQKVINKIADNEIIAVALRTASPELLEKIMSNCTEGRKALIEDAEEGLGMVRRIDIEVAQSVIVKKVKDLEKIGEIIIKRSDEEII